MKNHHRSKQAFTLIELIVLIAVLAVLGLLLFPMISGYVDASKTATCEQNLGVINRSYLLAKASEENVSIKAVLENKESKYYNGSSKCPSDGTYTPKYSVVVCSEHISKYDLMIFDKELYGKTVEIREEAWRCDGLSTPDKVKACYKQLYNFDYFNNDNLLRKLYAENGNKWDKIDPEIAAKGGVSENLFVRPFFTSTKISFLFASTSNAVTGNWNSQLLYYEGTWYKVKSGNATDHNDKNASQFEEYLRNNGAKIE